MWSKEHRPRAPQVPQPLSPSRGLCKPLPSASDPRGLLSPPPQTRTQAWFLSIRLRSGSPESLVPLTRQTARAEPRGACPDFGRQKVNRVRKQTSCSAAAAEGPSGNSGSHPVCVQGTLSLTLRRCGGEGARPYSLGKGSTGSECLKLCKVTGTSNSA